MPVVLENRRSSRGGRIPCTLPLVPPLLAVRLMDDQGLFYGGSTKVEGPAKEKRECLIITLRVVYHPLGAYSSFFFSPL